MTDITFYQYYPGGCFKQLADAAGVTVTNNQYALGGPVEQLRALINPALVLDQHALGGCWRQAEVVVEGGVGGGSAPEWVPANAKIHIDLVGNRAWTVADGEVAIDTLLGSDPNTEGYYGPSGYDPANLTADGYVATDVYYAAFIGVAKTKLLSTFTANFQIKTLPVPDADVSSVMALASTDGNSGLNVDVETSVDVGLSSDQSWMSGNVTFASRLME